MMMLALIIDTSFRHNVLEKQSSRLHRFYQLRPKGGQPPVSGSCHIQLISQVLAQLSMEMDCIAGLVGCNQLIAEIFLN